MRDSKLCSFNKDSFSIEAQMVDVINFQEEEDGRWEDKGYGQEGFKADGKIWHVS